MGKICIVCGTKLEGKQKKYCSPKCKNSTRKHQLCLVCEKKLSGQQKKFCSKKCSNSRQKKKQRENKPKKFCVYCKNELSAYQRKFCSRRCNNKSHPTRNNYKPRPKTIKIKRCKICNQVFETTNNLVKMCSDECKKMNMEIGYQKSRQRQTCKILSKHEEEMAHDPESLPREFMAEMIMITCDKQVSCSDCGWEGSDKDLTNGKCPECYLVIENPIEV